MIDTTFYVIALHRYQEFILPYITSVLWHNPNAFVEVVVKNTDCIAIKQREFLNYHFVNRWDVHDIPRYIDYSRFSSKHIKSMRWLSIPQHKNKYTYIGDIDILVLDSGITNMHVQHMNYIKKPYSNIVRNHPTKSKCTGLHFVETEKYYNKETLNYLAEIRKNIGKIPTKLLDEILLYRIVSNCFGIPTIHAQNSINKVAPWNNLYFRPIHGIHTTLSRPWTGWGANKIEFKKYQNFRITDIWKSGAKIFNKWYLDNIYYNIEPAHALWQRWMEWKHLRTVIPREVVVKHLKIEKVLMKWHKAKNHRKMELVLNVLNQRYRQCQKS